MNKLIIQIMASFIFNKQKRKEFRKKYNTLPKIKGCDNKIILVYKNNKKEVKTINNVDIRIHGNNNKVIFHTPLPNFVKSKIDLVGDNNLIELGSSPYTIELEISCKWRNHNRQIRIGNNFSSEKTSIFINEDNAILDIGDDCMFSNDIEIRTDGHAILDEKGNVVNNICEIMIGNHCWIGRRCLILKKAVLPDNSILGANSLLNKNHNEKNCVYAGNPAKKIKEKIKWLRENASIYNRESK